MGGLKKRGPKHKKRVRNEIAPSFKNELTKEDLKFKRMMEEGNIYKKVHGVNRQVR